MAIIGADAISTVAISGLSIAAAAPTDDTIITGTYCDDSVIYDACVDLYCNTEEQPEAITRVTPDDAVVVDADYETVQVEAQVDDDLEALEFLDFARGPPDQDDGYVLPSVWSDPDEAVEDDQTDGGIRPILSTPDDETGETTARFVQADDQDDALDDVEGFTLSAPDQDDQYVLTPSQAADEDAEDFDSSFVQMSPDDAAAAADGDYETIAAADADDAADDDDATGVAFGALDDAPVVDADYETIVVSDPDDWQDEDADPAPFRIVDQDDQYTRLSQADADDDAVDDDLAGVPAGILADAPVVDADYEIIVLTDPEDLADDDEAVGVAGGTLADAVVITDDDPRAFIGRNDDGDDLPPEDEQAQYASATIDVAAAVTPPVVAGDYGGAGRKRKKKRVIPLYEDKETSGDAWGTQPLPEQAGERAPPPATLPADHLAALRAWEAFRPVEYRVPTWTDNTDWQALSEAIERQERERQALEAKRAAERRAAEAWLVGAIDEVVRSFVDENAPKAEEAFARYHEMRRRREEDEERFLILAAMELFR